MLERERGGGITEFSLISFSQLVASALCKRKTGFARIDGHIKELNDQDDTLVDLYTNA